MRSHSQPNIHHRVDCYLLQGLRLLHWVPLWYTGCGITREASKRHRNNAIKSTLQFGGWTFKETVQPRRFTVHFLGGSWQTLKKRYLKFVWCCFFAQLLQGFTVLQSESFILAGRDFFLELTYVIQAVTVKMSRFSSLLPVQLGRLVRQERTFNRLIVPGEIATFQTVSEISRFV